ncbi:uncharacterized protein NDAI_0I01040 [Naumovozyma dairenensis CBS 421]|uniref:RING-CH-type domain-containing protein n=1 Tax=Naumovozyma dairenensis (strain ATCC 10597 / BCRC 20456 / CBS 421 / NBRC 0211 / NRRL Y-12639) TaxID=1071378 RepID=G0WFW2_NAUDC|nr:hypothetical protein NDAI_0I01040 [Naumovozyma dairenensis CBS 421]CCD26673.1 hypothetical protein NDAI_0I01040 [Naumovozyma dairenensis CBS 421]
MFSFFKLQTCRCWICLEESEYDQTWLIHKCGCNLQVHKTCYLQWIYKRNMDDYELLRPIFDNVDQRVKASLYHILDNHPYFPREGMWNKNNLLFSLISPQPIRMLGIYTMFFKEIVNTDSLILSRSQCPQCQKQIQLTDLRPYKSPILLDLIYQWKLTLDYIGRHATYLTIPLVLAPWSIQKFLVRIGLRQLQCLFPESILRIILDTVTTKSLNTFSETTSGLASIPPYTRFLLFLTPLSFFAINSHVFPSSAVRIIWTSLILRRINVKYTKDTPILKTARKLFLISNSLIMLYFNVMRQLLSSTIYKKLAQSVLLSIQQEFVKVEPLRKDTPNDDDDDAYRENMLDYSQTLVYSGDFENIIECLAWPFIGNFIGQKLLNGLLKLKRIYKFKWLHFIYDGETDQMIFNFIGCGILPVIKQLARLYASKKYTEELHATANFIFNELEFPNVIKYYRPFEIMTKPVYIEGELLEKLKKQVHYEDKQGDY